MSQTGSLHGYVNASLSYYRNMNPDNSSNLNVTNIEYCRLVWLYRFTTMLLDIAMIANHRAHYLTAQTKQLTLHSVLIATIAMVSVCNGGIYLRRSLSLCSLLRCVYVSSLNIFKSCAYYSIWYFPSRPLLPIWFPIFRRIFLWNFNAIAIWRVKSVCNCSMKQVK